MEHLIVQTFFTSLTSASVLILVASGLTLVFGILHVVNFAHGEFYMLGGFFAWIFFSSSAALPIESSMVRYLAAIILAMISVAVLGILVERTVYRPFRGVFGAGVIVAIGMVLILQGVSQAVFGNKEKTIDSPFTGNLYVGDMQISGERLAVILSSAVIMLCIFIFIKKSRPGKAMRAVAQNMIGAKLQGINVNHIFYLGMGIGSALAGAAGALIAPLFYINPFMGQLPIMKAFVVIVLGGMGSIPGAIIGSLIVAFVENYTAVLFGGHLATMAIMAIVVVMLIIRPQGILGHEE